MTQTFLDKWRHRITGAWQVLTGQAFAAYYFDDCMQKYWRPDLTHLEGIKLPPGAGPLITDDLQ